MVSARLFGDIIVMPRIRAPFRYAGSNANMIKDILPYIPYGRGIDWNEPFCGTAVLTLNKERHLLETINDANGDITNFFKVLRDSKKELIERIKLTPYSKDALVATYENRGDWNYVMLPVEKARLFYARQMLSRNGADRSPSWKRQFKSMDKNGRLMKPAAKSFMDTDHLDKYAERLCGVQIENLDVFKYIDDYDHPLAMFYFDPTFLPSTRKNKRLYQHEMEVEDHERFIERIKTLQGMAMIRHYMCEEYDSLGWRRVDFNKRVDGTASQRDSLYLSPSLTSFLDNQ